MTKQIPIGAVLQINASHRLTYLGDGKATMERLYVNRLDNQSPDYGKEVGWKADDAPATLTDKQITFWQSKI